MSFYERFNGWDSFIHLISGCLTPALALSMINILTGILCSSKTCHPDLSLFSCFFAKRCKPYMGVSRTFQRLLSEPTI